MEHVTDPQDMGNMVHTTQPQDMGSVVHTTQPQDMDGSGTHLPSAVHGKHWYTPPNCGTQEAWCTPPQDMRSIGTHHPAFGHGKHGTHTQPQDMGSIGTHSQPWDMGSMVHTTHTQDIGSMVHATQPQDNGSMEHTTQPRDFLVHGGANSQTPIWWVHFIRQINRLHSFEGSMFVPADRGTLSNQKAAIVSASATRQ
ncbi:hypothetical protein NDU88_012385 [Pleurodeles waltl]|uniref:Uncharacterized protein n=1 Tax=Pleurodeles waltl TaxID=8319 RepID=A0AAV7R5S7_PLEWA|nr:hypothetical protein NDU88_012385 [Pleurodeles waltl]